MAMVLDSGVACEPSLSEHLARLSAQGYVHELQVLADGHVLCVTQGRTCDASDLHVRSFQRFEGQSDPDDMLLVAAVQMPDHSFDDCRGVLVLGFGPTASAEHKKVLAALTFDGPDAQNR